MEENYNNEIANFNEDWNRKLYDFNNTSRKVEELLSERHKKEVEDLVKSIEDQFGRELKYNSEYLKYKDAEMRLVKQKE